MEGKGIVITGGAEDRRACRSLERFATEVVSLMERAFGMPLDRVLADRAAVPRQRVAAVA